MVIERRGREGERERGREGERERSESELFICNPGGGMKAPMETNTSRGHYQTRQALGVTRPDCLSYLVVPLGVFVRPE